MFRFRQVHMVDLAVAVGKRERESRCHLSRFTGREEGRLGNFQPRESPDISILRAV